MSGAANALGELMERNVFEVFAERDPIRRRRAIEELYTEDCAFYDAEAEGTGQAGVFDMVERILADGPADFAFTLVSPADVIHDLGRLRWQLGPAEATPVVRGMDVAVFAKGRIRTLYTFIETPAPSEAQARTS